MRRLLVVTAAQLTMCGRSPETRQVFGEYLQVRYSDTRTNVTMSEIAAHEPAIFLPVSTAHEHWMLVRNRSRRGTINATELPFLPMPPALPYPGWLRPRPPPPRGIGPEAGETLNYIAGHYRIFQYADGHRFSTDDVLTAWYATQWAPRVGRAAGLGSGIGAVALVVAWRVVGARIVTVEAQAMSVRLARKSVRYNGIEDRVDVREGDLRDFGGDEQPFDLVTGSPPYFPPGTAVEAGHPQAVPARIEVRGSVADYARTAARLLAPGGLFAFVFPFAQRERAEAALREHGLVLLRRRDVVFKEREAPMISLFAAARAADLPPGRAAFVEPPLTIRRADGSMDREYAMGRLSFGFPPGDVPAYVPGTEITPPYV